MSSEAQNNSYFYDPRYGGHPAEAIQIGPHSYMWWYLKDELETDEYVTELPRDLLGILPTIIGDMGALPEEKLRVYEEAAQGFNLKFKDLYGIEVVGPLEEILNDVPELKSHDTNKPKRMGRPPMEREVNNYLAERALKIRIQNKMPWADLAYQVLQELIRDNDNALLDETGMTALAKLQTMCDTSNRKKIGSFLQKLVERAPKHIQQK